MALLSVQLRNRLGLLKSYVLRQSHVPGGPLTLAIESTAKCNLFCPMCPRESIYFPPKDMELSVFKKIIDDGKAFLEFAVPYGDGEPLLNPEIYDMIAYCKQVGVPSGISTNATVLSGTNGASFPFWSNDNQSVGFFADGKLKKIAVIGGPPQTLCDAPNGRGGSWNATSWRTGASGTSS